MYILLFLSLRIKQLYRAIAELGWIRGGLFVLLITGSTVFYYDKMLKTGSLNFQLLMSFFLISLPLARSDAKFLALWREKKKWILLAEYGTLIFLMELPFWILDSFSFYTLLPLVGLMIGVFIEPFFTGSFSSSFLSFWEKITNLIPLHAFEWRGVIRRFNFFIIFLYLMGLVLLYFFPLMPFILFFFMAYSMEAYTAVENKEIIQGYESIPNFRRKKIGAFFGVINALFFPYALMHLVLYPHPIWIGVLVVSIVFVNIYGIYLLLNKYEDWNSIHHQKLNIIPTLIFSLVAILLPLSLYMILNTWKHIKHQMRPYLTYKK